MNREEFIDAAFAELKRIESGQATVQLIEGDLLLGKVRYKTSNNWIIVIFSDGDVWDYIDSISPPTGEQFSLWPDAQAQEADELIKLRSYHPPGSQSRTIWGFLA